MQIFELYFNPKLNEDCFFDSFIYDPENIYEKRLGSLYVVGELKNALPQNSRLITNLTNAIKEKYYTLSLKFPEKAISEGLKKANDFLSDEVKKDNVSWLGNLNLALFSIKNFDLIFTKTGEIKILLVRGGEIMDIGKNLDLQEIDPYPLKIFFSIVSGRLSPDDLIIVLTKDIYNFFLKENLLKKIAQTESLDEKKIKEILPSELLKKERVSGVCFIINLTQEFLKNRKSKEVFLQKTKIFPFSELFSVFRKPILFVKKIFSFVGKLAKFLKKPKKTKKTRPKKKNHRKAKKEFSFFPTFKSIIENPKSKKDLILILILFLFLFLGFIIFRKILL